jgi:DNA-binding transcriptional LysR family regulator
VQKYTIMNWDDLRYFLALSRAGSVSRAGKALGVNHTTVARRIGTLENELKTRLFERTSEGYEMTQAAEDMYEHALQMEERAQAIDREVFAQDAELKGPLKLTVSHDVASRLIVPKLTEFHRAYPGIDLDVLTTTGLVDLAAREADIALRLTARPPDYLVGREVLPLRHGIYGAPDYLQRASDLVDVILFRGDMDMPAWVTENYAQARVALRVDDVTTMLAAVRSGLGLARMPCYIGDSDRTVRRIDVALTPSTWGIWILSHVDLRCTARVRVCREFLFDAIEQQRALVLGKSSRYFVPKGGS